MTDIVIIGAGPAGLTLGCYLAKAGIRCLIIEKAHHPRAHVGESLLPATARVIKEIGFLDIMETSDFPRSEGVVYHPQVDSDVSVSYAQFPQEGNDQRHTYHVDRAKFDVLLLKHAESLGCRILEGVSVEEVTFGADGYVDGVRARVGDQDVVMPSRLVVDASGRATKLGHQLDLRHNHPVLDQFAIHAWCVGVDRGRVETESYSHMYFIPELRGWAWLAPIDSKTTSIGVVAAKQVYQDSGLDIDDFFMSCLEGNVKLANATRSAVRVNDLKGETSYSYRLRRVCGDGWLAMGDAARFIDPVFSSGVSVAMHTARLAAEQIEAALSGDDFSRTVFLPYEDKLFTGAAIWDDFIRLFYRLLPAFTHLLESPDHRPSILRMIQGGVNSESDASVLQDLRELVRSVEEADTHPWQGDLVDLPL